MWFIKVHRCRHRLYHRVITSAQDRLRRPLVTLASHRQKYDKTQVAVTVTTVPL